MYIRWSLTEKSSKIRRAPESAKTVSGDRYSGRGIGGIGSLCGGSNLSE